MNQSKFEGREPSLKGFTYDLTREQNPDQFIKMTKAIINYAGRTYTKYTAEFTQAVRDLELDEPTAQENPDPGDVLAFEISMETRHQGASNQRRRVLKLSHWTVQSHTRTMH